MRTHRRALTALVLAFLVPACGGPRTRAPAVDPGRNGLPVRVENESGTGLRVFALIANNEMQLGRVEAMGAGDFHLPAGISGTVTLIARSLSGNATGDEHASEPFTLAVGQRVTWQLRGGVGQTLPRSSLIFVSACNEREPC